MPMTDTDVESLLGPVSADLPCGKNLEYLPPFTQLMELARVKPEQTIGDKTLARQDPPWPKVREEAERVLRSTKDLRVAGILHCALLETEGIAGLSASLALFRGLLERYWESLYPPLDAEDNNDSTFRVNCLVAALTADDALTALRLMPLVQSRQFGAPSLRQYRIVTGAIKPNTDAQQPSDLVQETAKFAGAFQSADIAVLQAGALAAAGAADHLNGIEKILLERAGGIPDALGALRTDVKELNAVFTAQLAKRGAAPVMQGPAPGAVNSPAPAATLQGEIRSRADVVRTLDALCDYYTRNEPSSPIPLLLTRAKRLVHKGFMDIIRDLAPAGVAEAEVIGGLEKKE
jgi:type VI secretion system protein ImpA